MALVGLLANNSLVLNAPTTDAYGCETTYVYEGYEPVDLPSNLTSRFPGYYKVVRYVDRDPRLHMHMQSLKHQSRLDTTSVHHRATVLFVHGHLGSPKQMRSMASETSRELFRRFSSSISNWNKTWIDFDWLATDFGSEPSGFEPLLLKRQSRFVAACMSYLVQGPHSPVLMVVGFSMGGVAVEQALLEFRGEIGPSMVITLGSPRQYWSSFLSSRQLVHGEEGTRRQTTTVPTMINIVSGSGDGLVSRLSAWTTTSPSSRNFFSDANQSLSLDIDMEDIPGVWTTCSHSDIVSCNQLVRTIVPMLVDNVVQKTEGDNMKLYRRWLTSSALETELDALDTAVFANLDAVTFHDKHHWTQHCQTLVPEDMVLTQQGSEDVCFEWSGDFDDYDHIVVAAFAGSEAVHLYANRSDASRESSLVELPYSLYPNRRLTSQHSAGRKKQRRPWTEVVAGINWRRNATRLYFHSARDRRSFVLRLRKSSERLQVVVAFVPGPFKLPRVESLEFSRSFLRNFVASSFVFNPSKKSPLYLLHSSLPSVFESFFQKYLWLSVRPLGGSCDLVPVLIAQNSQNSQNSHDTVRLSSMALWHPGVVGRDILLLAHPLCSYQVTKRLDLLGPAASTVRHHVLDVYPLVLASVVGSMAGARLRLRLLVIALAVWLSRSPTSPPLDVPGVAVLLVLARCLHGLLQSCLSFFLQCTTRLFSTSLNSYGFLKWIVGLLCVAGSGILHPGIAGLGGLLALSVPDQSRSIVSVPESKSLYHKWYLFHSLAAVPSFIWLYGWLASRSSSPSRNYSYGWGFDGLFSPSFFASMIIIDLVDVVCVWIIALHAYTLRHSLKNIDSKGREMVMAKALQNGTMAVLTIVGVGGHSRLVVPSVATFCACDLLLGRFQVLLS